MPKKYTPTPKTDETYSQTRYNAIRHGALSYVEILPWEDEAAHIQLQDDLIAEHKPQGASEVHLVLELAKCIIRKQRLYQAEKALTLHNVGSISNYDLRGANFLTSNAMQLAESNSMNLKLILYHNSDTDQQEISTWNEFIKSIQALIDSDLSYKAMVERCNPTIIKAWKAELEEDDTCSPNAESFKQFLPKYITHGKKECNAVKARPYLKQQAIGIAYNPDKKMESLQRYEITIDRKFERTLGMLLKLQEVRKVRTQEPCVEIVPIISTE